MEQIVPRAIDPASVDGGGIGGGNLPELIETAEVIETNVVAIVRSPAEALDPPVVAFILHHIPTVKRISPALPGFAEKIRRHSGNHFGIKIVIQAEEPAVRPDIGAVVIDEDGDIAHDTNGALGTIAAQSLPLLTKGKLQGAANLQIVRQVLAGALDGLRLAAG